MKFKPHRHRFSSLGSAVGLFLGAILQTSLTPIKYDKTELRQRIALCE